MKLPNSVEEWNIVKTKTAREKAELLAYFFNKHENHEDSFDDLEFGRVLQLMGEDELSGQYFVEAFEAYNAGKLPEINGLNLRSLIGGLCISKKAIGDNAELEKYLREGIRHFPTDGYFLNTLGNLMLQSRRYEEAEEVFLKVEAYRPEIYSGGASGLGCAYYGQNKLTEARVMFSRAVSQDSSIALDSYGLATIGKDIGDIELAHEFYQIAVSADKLKKYSRLAKTDLCGIEKNKNFETYLKNGGQLDWDNPQSRDDFYPYAEKTLG